MRIRIRNTAKNLGGVSSLSLPQCKYEPDERGDLPVWNVRDSDMLHELLVRDGLDLDIRPGIDHNKNLQICE